MRTALRGSLVVAILSSLVLGSGSALAQPAQCTPPPAGMVGWWPGDGNANDIAGTNHGAVVGGVTYSPGLVGQAFNLNGSTGYVEVPDSAALEVTGQLTIDAWINAVSLGGRVVDKIAAGQANGYLLDTYGGRVRFIVDGQILSGSSTLPTGTWVHIAGVYDGSEMRVYLNGALDGSLALSGPIPTNNLTLRIGAASDAGSLFSGLVDEVEVFNRGLSQAELQAIVTAGSAGKCKPGEHTIPALSTLGLAALAVLLAAFGALRARH
jgi:hypothetical protein